MAAPLIQAVGMSSGYGPRLVVHHVDLEVSAGEVVAVLGPNGAGKTTTLLTLAGELPVASGEVRWNGRPTKAPYHRRAREGLGFITEERSVFTKLTVAENLRVGKCDVASALALFPELETCLRHRAGTLSGGQQQMLALARALSRSPRLLLADELSLGLAPLIVNRLLKAVRDAADLHGVGVLMVEQHVKKAMDIADRVYVLRRGRVELSGRADELRGRLEEVQALYLSGAVA